LIASQIIKTKNASALNSITKVVNNVEKNQASLLESLQEQTGAILLDGHFTLLCSDESIRSIDPSLFISMDPKILILIDDDVGKIADRLRQRDERSYKLSTLIDHQRAERSHAKKIAGLLSIPLHIFKPDETARIITVLRAAETALQSTQIG
jgi:adenylate kinase